MNHVTILMTSFQFSTESGSAYNHLWGISFFLLFILLIKNESFQDVCRESDGLVAENTNDSF